MELRHRTADVPPVGTMLAVVADRYGAPEEVLELAEIAKPIVGNGEVLVRVQAAPVGGTDWHLLRGLPYAARPVTGVRKPRNRVQGLELAGIVETVGRGVTGFQVGDEVFGWCGGTFAEYAAVPDAQLMPKPANLTMEEAAAVPISAFTALQGVRDKGRVRPGQKVLISGASGGVGSYALQIAKAFGAEVTAVCSKAKTEMVRSLGADHVIDYTAVDFTRTGDRYDVFLDIYGNPSLSDCRRLVKPGGVVVFIGGTGGRWFMGVDRWLRALLAAPFLGIEVRPLIHKDSREDLATITQMIESGALTPVLGETYPLSRVAEAIGVVKDGRVHGQVVVTLGGATWNTK
jgi:NADPH:quinone reductase-like Zn-dependent oxidoreductase